MSISIRHFLKPKDGLPDPQVPLSNGLTTSAILSMNSEVARAQSDASTAKKKRGPYKK